MGGQGEGVPFDLSLFSSLTSGRKVVGRIINHVHETVGINRVKHTSKEIGVFIAGRFEVGVGKDILVDIVSPGCPEVMGVIKVVIKDVSPYPFFTKV